ncbi:hypothetical protein COEREDRAFT_89659 [Coemansia reversa NRRL 1564]|uniref:Arrestin-like N-terminal domain-containing protein n=1 Tax=Coemansia reversa (strain ATCC 12441 / NRRL 1564) TaxID=763665 RepID=A0A2G5B2R7_COERN|nr:hypothetical protein COEREDRAFT_89659 [Coemansia reversa NRRL 1564]|eukprot:PIA13310.1 hypothetical protein COEREDRAFT_89659 [Coemansia reversa NRRL 1564]
MANSDNSWPKFLRRMSASVGGDNAVTQSSPHQGTAYQSQMQQQSEWQQHIPQHQPPRNGPPLPPRHNQQLYQPPEHHAGITTSSSYLSTGIQNISLNLNQPISAPATSAVLQRANRDRVSSEFGASSKSPLPLIDDRPPTTDRVAEFRLDIPDGVRNMTQHPEDTIVGSVVITVTKPTKALRISLSFLGQQRVYVRDASNQTSLSPYTNIDYTMFEKHLSLWGHKMDIDSSSTPTSHLETLPPGTLIIPFSIKLPRVNYPSTIKREKACRVRYLVWATFERPGTFKDHTMTTHKEEICFEPLAYPTQPAKVHRISKTIAGNPDSSITANIAVQVSGGLLQLPAVAGERIRYQIEARAVLNQNMDANSADQQPVDIPQFIVRHVRIIIVERLKARGLIKGKEHIQSYHRDIHSVTLTPTGAKPGRSANSAAEHSSSGYIRLPLDMCPFNSKQLERDYEMRVECDVADKSSLLNKVTRQKSTYSMHVPLEICTIPPANFDTSAYQNAYTDDSRNMANIVPPPHYSAAVEPELAVGGWELERSYIKWDKFNPTWIELVRRKNPEC